MSNANPNLITSLNIYWMLHGKMMPLEEIKAEFDFTTKTAYDELALCRTAIENRGLPWSDSYLPPVKEVTVSKVPKAKNSELDYDPFFILACNVILQLGDKRTPAAKLKEVGLTVSKWENWLRNPKYMAFYEKLLKEKFDKVENELMLGLARNVAAGDLQSMKYFDERTGKFRPNTDMVINLGLVIGKLMEALARFLTPEQLNEVADVIEISLNDTKELTA